MIMPPMTWKTSKSNGVWSLKWLGTPRAACIAMSASSKTTMTAITLPAARASRAPRWTKLSIQAMVSA
jgi:hypothetical protein